MFLLLTFGAAALFYFYVKWRQNYWQRRGVPCPEFKFLFGTGDMSKHVCESVDDKYRLMKNQAPFIGLYMFTTPAVLVTQTSILKNLFVKDFEVFQDRGLPGDEDHDPLTKNLFQSKGEKWRRMRHKMTPTFTSGKLKAMFEIVLGVGERLVEVLDERNGTAVEMKEICSRFTTDVIGSTAFGLETNCLTEKNSEFRRIGLKMFESNFTRNIYLLFTFMFQDVARFFKLKTIDPEVEAFVYRIVRQTIRMREKNKIKRGDFLDMMIELKNTGSIDGTPVGKVTIDEIVANTFGFLLAGFETSSTALSFCLYELSLNSDLQNKLREEITKVKKENGGQLSYEMVNNIQYLNQVIDETLRLWPSPTSLVRTASRDYKIPDTEYVIPKGLLIQIPIYSMHRDEDLFPNAKKFDPDRFSEENKQKIPPFAYLPFGAGSRNCIGMRFAYMQIRIGLILLLTNFKFSVCDKTMIPMQLKVAVQPFLEPKDGIWLKVQKIS